MRKISVRGVLAAIELMAAGDGAYAQAIVPVDCSTNHGALAAQFSGTGGTANTTYQITGPCDGGFTITQNNITIQPSGFTAQTINGSVAVTGASNIGLFSLTINAGSPAGVQVIGPASVTLSGGATIQNGPNDGVLADGPALVSIRNTNTIQNNGGSGLHAQHGAVIEAETTTLTDNSFAGILAEQGSTVDFSGSISQGAILAHGAVIAQDSSNVRLGLTSVTGPQSFVPTVLVSRGSSALIESSNISADTPFFASNPHAVVTAAQSSTIRLEGGNTITNSAAGGTAVLVSEGSAVVEEDAVSPADSINGDGRVNTQSIIELGAGAFGGASITWTGNLFVSQFSSFRADGAGVTVTGTLSLGQAGNAYFNQTQGTSNAVAHVVCQSTTDHVANPTLVTPNVTIGPSPPACQAF